MTATLWYLACGLLLVVLALTDHLFKRLPVSGPAICLAVGLVFGPAGLALFSVDEIEHAVLFEHLTEVAVIVSLFTAGLNMRTSLKDPRWLEPIRLATVAMLLTIGALTVIGVWFLALPLGAAVLLGAILAPTDPVLAADVQLEHAGDKDELRHALTGEAGLNDGLAFPFVVLGLALLAGTFEPARWLGWDVAWAITAGLAAGGATGWLLGKVMISLQRHRDVQFALHESIVLGIIALAYGLAELVDAYGFLAVFASGYALRYIELRAAGFTESPPELPAVHLTEGPAADELRESPEKAAHHLTVALLQFNQKLEHILMAGMIVLLGGVTTLTDWPREIWFLVPLLFLVVRPLSVAVATVGSCQTRTQRVLAGWFGIRGLGSLYYLAFAITHGLDESLAQRLSSLVLPVVVVSILVHGATASFLMSWYDRRKR